MATRGWITGLHWACLVTILSAATPACGEGPAPSAGSGPRRVFIVAGQSNALGINHVREYAAGKRPLPDALRHQPAALAWDASRRRGDARGTWAPLEIHESGAFGPEIGFAHQLAERFPGTRLAIIKYAVGGTGIARSVDYADFIPQLKGFDDHGQNWHPGGDGCETGVLYRRLIQEVRDAFAALEQAGESAELAGVIWMQGEHEAGISPTMAADYDRLLTTLMQAIRRDLEAPRLPFLVGEINGHTWAFGDVARRTQAAACDKDGHAVLVPTTDLPRAGSGGAAHFDADGMVELGIRFARAFPGFARQSPPAGAR